MGFRLKVVDGQPRATFPDEEPQRGDLLSHLLVPDPHYITILLWETMRVEKKRAEGWIYDEAKLRITCTPESLVIEESAPTVCIRDNSARVALSLSEAKQLLSKWRFERLKWEFRQMYRKAKGDLKMQTRTSQDKGAIARPILFRVSDPLGHHLGFARNLVGVVRIADRKRRRGEKQSTFSITAVYADGSEDLLLPKQYCWRKEATVEDAILYITTRDEGIRLAKEMGISELQIDKILGEQRERCSPGDSEKKQIEDYIKNATEEWLTDEELRAEEANIFRLINSRKKKRQVSFIFST